MARRGMWLIGGVAVGVGALVLKPDTRTWLLRRLGLEPEDRRWFEEDDAQPAEHEGDEPLDTREARFSLRARLAEEGLAEPAATASPLAAAPPPAPVSPPPSFERTPEPPAPLFASVPPVAPAPEPDETEPAESAEDAPITAEAEVADPVVDEPAAAEPVAEPARDEPAAEAPAEAEPATPPDRPWAAPVAVPEPESEPGPAPAAALAFESVPAIGPEDDAPKTPGEDTSEIEQLEESPYLTFQAPAVVPTPAADDEDAPPPPTPLRPPTAPASPSRPFSESTSFRSAIDAARERVHGAAREATPDEGESTEPLDERDS